MTHENQLPESVITNQEVAWDMAHAEKPYQELALTAQTVGLEDEATEAKTKANNAGLAAGRAAVIELHAQIEAGTSAGEKATVSLNKTVETPSIWETLSPEKHIQAKAVITAMAEKFGVKEGDFTLVKTEQDGKETLSAVYAGNGIDLGDSSKDYDKRRSYNAVMSEKTAKNFMVEVNGKQLDSRSGMTEAAYRTLYADAKARGATLPDSEQMAKENDDVWTWTLLTGESADGSYARLARVSGDKPRVSWAYRDYDGRSVRFRPAVVIE